MGVPCKHSIFLKTLRLQKAWEERFLLLDDCTGVMLCNLIFLTRKFIFYLHIKFLRLRSFEKASFLAKGKSFWKAFYVGIRKTQKIHIGNKKTQKCKARKMKQKMSIKTQKCKKKMRYFKNESIFQLNLGYVLKRCRKKLKQKQAIK